MSTGTPDIRNGASVTMYPKPLANVRRKITQLALCWIAIRLVTDFPRGLLASQVNVPAVLGHLSYSLLPIWLLIVFSQVRLRAPQDKTFKPIVSAGLALLVYQAFALALIGAKFGGQGLVAGSYLILVGTSFVTITLLGHHLGRRLFSVGEVDSLSNTLLLITCPNLVWGATQLLFGLGRDVDGVSRIYGLTSSPNILTAVAAINTLGLVTLNAFVGGRRHLSLAVLLWFGLAVSTFSLAGFGALLFALVVWRLLSRNARPVTLAKKLANLLTLLAFCSVAWNYASDILLQRLSEFNNEQNSLVWRLFVWQLYLDALNDPSILIFGGGLGYDHLAMPDDAHNEYLRVTIELGLLGLLLFLAPYYQSIRAALRWRQTVASGAIFAPKEKSRSMILSAGVIAIICFCLINGTVEAVMRSSPSMLLAWFYVGLFSGLTHMKDSD